MFGVHADGGGLGLRGWFGFTNSHWAVQPLEPGCCSVFAQGRMEEKNA